MRVIVTGSRTWTDRDAVWDRLDKLPSPVTIVHGACATGADSWAHDWVRTRKLVFFGYVTEETHPADWAEHERRAGPIRNSKMAAAGADLCIAFRSAGKSNGTDDMIAKARAAGIPVEIVTPHDDN